MSEYNMTALLHSDEFYNYVETSQNLFGHKVLFCPLDMN